MLIFTFVKRGSALSASSLFYAFKLFHPIVTLPHDATVKDDLHKTHLAFSQYPENSSAVLASICLEKVNMHFCILQNFQPALPAQRSHTA